MGELIPFPIQIRPNDYWQFYNPWSPNGHWATCTTCFRTECSRAGHTFMACEYHSANQNPPEPYVYPTPRWDDDTDG